MRSIQHLSPGEQQHFILCDCGEYIDMRNLSEVFKHLHANLPEPEWSHSIKKGESKMYIKNNGEASLS